MYRKARKSLGVVVVVILIAPLAVAAWTSASSSTTNGLTVSPTQDIVGYVGHVTDWAYLNTANVRGHEADFVSRNSGHSFGPANGWVDTGTAYNTIHVSWNSLSTGDGDRNLGVWNVGNKVWGQGQSFVTNGATYDGIYTQRVTGILLTVQTPTGPVQYGSLSLPQQGPLFNQQRLTNNASFNIPDPGQHTALMGNIPPQGPPLYFTAYAGSGSSSVPSVDLQVDVQGSLTHTWSHPAEVPSYVSVLADLYMQIHAYIGFQ